VHPNIIISFFEKDGTICSSGQARVENGQIVAIFLNYNDNSTEMYKKNFYNKNKSRPTIENGISEMIYTADGEEFKVIFIEKLKPKQKTVKEAALPGDL
jgi:hypothetical protein